MLNTRPAQVLYIKLGRNGQWEAECLTTGTLKLGYRETPHDLCVAAKWDEVQKVQEKRRKNKGAATSDVTQLRLFYESSAEVMWVTFSKNSLWWCFSIPDIMLLPDGSKQRTVVERWSNADVDGQPLLMSQLSGKVLAMQGFQGTICSVRDEAYLVNRINGIQPKEVVEAERALGQLEDKIETLIRSLTWRDFELLIDLIFRQAGWLRVSDVGATMKAIDLDLISPITAERYGVQVKARADLAVFEEYRDARLKDMQGFTRFYFAVHSPSASLSKEAGSTTGNVELLLPSEIAHLAVQYGLTTWIIDKAR